MSRAIQQLGRRLRLGVIGGGPESFIGAIHQSAATMHGEFGVVAGVLSSDPGRALTAAKLVGIPRGYSSPRALFESESQRQDGVDAIAVITPNNSHYDYSMQALAAGFHVMIEKPLTITEKEGIELLRTLRQTGKCGCVAYGYTGYPMVRQARAMVASGVIGEIKMLQSNYVQGHLAELTAGELDGSNWHMNPEQAGPSLILGDIGTHSYHLLSFVTGMTPVQLSADVTNIVAGRTVDDYCAIWLRYGNRARGQLWVTQAAAGGVHGLGFTIYGAKGGLVWQQEQPDELLVRPLDAPAYMLKKGGKGLHPAAERASHLAIGHPEGYREAFANLYLDFASHIVDNISGNSPDPLSLWYPTVSDGVEGIAFIYAALRSRDNGGQWETI
ncbi:Gfo/Idh/MocA family protein [Endozoicomonas sp.]|uniref:Gfo/Idh/MocA family protein n=1 Tax=Endozoicomonas sp. TaxID=1892382 RepID=UPI002883F5C5|nr:Gfo/Idh/MocA family oxidoreductase [Endozoicomonas sp.]